MLTVSPPSPHIVIGAGLSGLSTAFFLKQRNVPVLILEASSHSGGNCRETQSEVTGPRHLDSSHNLLRHWLPRLGLRAEASPLPQVDGLGRKHQPHLTVKPNLLDSTPSLWSQLLKQKETFIKSSLSVRNLLKDFKNPDLVLYVKQLLRLYYGQECEDLHASHLFDDFYFSNSRFPQWNPQNDEAYRLVGGGAALIRRLKAELAEPEIVLNAPVRKLKRTSLGWQVEFFKNGRVFQMQTPSVSLALPPFYYPRIEFENISRSLERNLTAAASYKASQVLTWAFQLHSPVLSDCRHILTADFCCWLEDEGWTLRVSQGGAACEAIENHKSDEILSRVCDWTGWKLTASQVKTSHRAFEKNAWLGARPLTYQAVDAEPAWRQHRLNLNYTLSRHAGFMEGAFESGWKAAQNIFRMDFHSSRLECPV